MKLIKPIIFLLVMVTGMNLQSQGTKCISGDCTNGYGKITFGGLRPGIYEGNFVNGAWNGQGTLEMKGQYIYTGEFKNNILEGKGKLTFVNGEQYVGEFSNNAMHGNATYTYKNGEKFTGIYKNNVPFSGFGYIPIDSTKFYKGNLAEGKLSGQGKITYYNGQFIEGNFIANELEGTGTFVGNDGTKYEGNFKKSQFHGYGEAKFLDGTYKGNYEMGKRQGYGKYYDLAGNLKFEGNWENDKPVVPVQTQPDPFYTYEKAFKRCYKGKLKTTLYGQEGYIDLYECYTLHRDYTITGTSVSTISIDNVDYKSKTTVNAYLNTDTYKITYYPGSVISQDRLPGDLYWIKGSTAYATLYNNSDHSGYYLIQGKNSEGNLFEMTDY